MTAPDEPLLEVEAVTKRYGAATVLDGCRLEVRAGEVHALIGGNGAGKSTTAKIIAGLVAPTAVAMRLAGSPYAPRDKREAESRGVQIVQQELNLVPELGVAENLFLTRLPARCGVVRRGELHRQARRLLDRFGMPDIDPQAPVSSLGVGRQQMLEIAAALDRDCRLLILDEPTAALSAAESEQLFSWLGRLSDRGVGVLYISHRLGEITRLCDRVTVLRDGRNVGVRETALLPTDDLVTLMTGANAAPGAETDHETYDRGEVVLRVEGLSGGPVRDVSFHVNRGERLGIAGLVGSGRTELLRLVFGADAAEAGCVRVGQRPTPSRFRHPCEAVAAGIAMVTEDRKQDGLLQSLSVRVNTTLASLRERFSTCGVVRSDKEARSTNEFRQSLDLRCFDIEQRVSTLSGGNQQKIAIAKWLARDADVFLFDEPTRGVDIAARRRIYRLIDTLARDGKGIVVVSSDLEELLGLCDRIAVMSNGKIADTFTRGDWSHERIMQASFSEHLIAKTV